MLCKVSVQAKSRYASQTEVQGFWLRLPVAFADALIGFSNGWLLLNSPFAAGAPTILNIKPMATMASMQSESLSLILNLRDFAIFAQQPHNTKIILYELYGFTYADACVE